jgi:hypothetical protein
VQLKIVMVLNFKKQSKNMKMDERIHIYIYIYKALKICRNFKIRNSLAPFLVNGVS